MSFKHWTTRDNSNISGAGPGAGSDAAAASAGPLKWAEILELAPTGVTSSPTGNYF